MQLDLFSSQSNSIIAESLCEQTVIRLVLAGVYPFYIKGESKFMYLIDQNDKITGTSNESNFKDHFPHTMYYKPSGALNQEELTQLERFSIPI